MYSFDNCFQLEKKKNNWDYLLRFFKKRSVPLTEVDFEGVIHCAPNAGYEFLKKTYGVLTGKEIQDTPSVETFEYIPDYAKQTIAQKMKDSELVRIGDNVTRSGQAEMIIGDHNS